MLLTLVNESIRRGWTYAQMSAAAGVERNTVTSWCRGDRTPNIVALERWAKALDGFLHSAMVDRVDCSDGQKSTNGAQ